MEKSSLKDPIKLMVIGGSAGSLDVILRALPDVSTDVSFPVVIVLHRKSSFDSALADLFGTKTRIIVKEAEEKELLTPGCIYLAPADYHLLIEKDHTLSIDYSERVHYSRPSIDVTFETAAEAYGSTLAAVLLSGANADGAEGLLRVQEAGGITAVQDPATAEVGYMPAQAMARMKVDHILSAPELASFINKLSGDSRSL